LEDRADPVSAADVSYLERAATERCTYSIYNVLTVYTMYLQYIQCTYSIYNVLTAHTMYLKHIQCTYSTYNVLTVRTMYLQYIQCTYDLILKVSGYLNRNILHVRTLSAGKFNGDASYILYVPHVSTSFPNDSPDHILWHQDITAQVGVVVAGETLILDLLEYEPLSLQTRYSTRDGACDL